MAVTGQLERAHCHEMIVRRDVAQAVVDRFRDRPLVWGVTDCGKMAGMSLRLLGHNPRMGRFSGYRTEFGARKRMKAAGFDDLPAVLNSLGLEVIPPVMVLPGDVLGLPGEGGLTALAVAIGNRNMLLFAPDGVCRIGELMASKLDLVQAWRVPPRKLVSR